MPVVGFLHDGGERLLGQPARLREAREVTDLAQLGDAQLHRAGARLPRPVAIAVALIEPIRTTLAVGGAGGARYMTLETIAPLSDDPVVNLPVPAE